MLDVAIDSIVADVDECPREPVSTFSCRHHGFPLFIPMDIVGQLGPVCIGFLEGMLEGSLVATAILLVVKTLVILIVVGF